MCGASGAFSSDQLVDSLAQVLQHEVLIRRRFAVIDFLGPLFERKFDAERLVDGEGDIEEVETVDLEIVDGVTLRLDILTRNVASFRNDFSHFIERGGHQTCSFRPRRGWTPARSGACKPDRAGPL